MNHPRSMTLDLDPGRSRSVIMIVSPAAARRTYSESLFFKLFRPTVRMPDKVASGGFFFNSTAHQRDWRRGAHSPCQAPQVPVGSSGARRKSTLIGFGLAGEAIA